MRIFFCLIILLLSLNTNVFANETDNDRYVMFEGYVKEETEINNNKAYLIQKSADVDCYAIIDENTINLNKKNFKIGDKVFVVYDSTKPSLMIYPAQYTALIIGLVKDDYLYRMDFFDKDLNNSDNSFRLNIDDRVSIFNLSKEKLNTFSGSKQAFIEYAKIENENNPSQITPNRIYVMEHSNPKISLYVNNKEVEANLFFKKDIIMLPVGEICSLLGIESDWNNEKCELIVGGKYKIVVGDSDYYYDSKAYSLETQAVLSDNRLYVPVSFFDMLYLNTKVVYDKNNVFIFKI